MAVKTVQATINDQTYTLTLNSTSGKYEATVTAPSKSSYNQSGHYYGVTVKATDVAGNITTKDAADETLGTSLRLQVKEKVAPIIAITAPTAGTYLTNNKPTITWQSFITRLLYTVKGENICVHQLPLSGYLFEKVERKICFNRMYPKCKEVQRW